MYETGRRDLGMILPPVLSTPFRNPRLSLKLDHFSAQSNIISGV